MIKVLFVGLLGLEPRTTEPKSAVLPLHHRPIKLATIRLVCLNIASANVVLKKKRILQGVLVKILKMLGFRNKFLLRAIDGVVVRYILY